MVCIDPAMCECVWLMIAVVCVCRLGEEYECGCVGVWVSGEVGWRDVFCGDNYGFSFLTI